MDPLVDFIATSILNFFGLNNVTKRSVKVLIVVLVILLPVLLAAILLA